MSSNSYVYCQLLLLPSHCICTSLHIPYKHIWNLCSQVHEMVMLIEEPGSVICWDFDVMKNDVSFSVLRTKVPITHRPEPQSPTGEACDIPWPPCQVSYNKGRLMFSLKSP